MKRVTSARDEGGATVAPVHAHLAPVHVHAHAHLAP